MGSCFPTSYLYALLRGSVVLTSVSTCALIYAVFPFEDLAFLHASSGGIEAALHVTTIFNGYGRDGVQ